MISELGISISLLGLLLTIIGLCGKKKAVGPTPASAVPVPRQTEITKPAEPTPAPVANEPKCEPQNSKTVDKKTAQPEKKDEGGSADKPAAKENEKKADQNGDGKPEGRSKKGNSKKSVKKTQSPGDDQEPEPDAPNSQKTQMSRTVKVKHDDDTIKHIESLKEDKNKSE